MKQRLRQVGWVVLAGVIGISGAWLTLGATPAAAGQVNCTTPSLEALCFGTRVGSSIFYSLSTSNWSLSGEFEAFKGPGTLAGASVFSYLYEIDSFKAEPSSLSQITTATNPGVDNFDKTLNFGLHEFETTFLGGLSAYPSFTFGSSSLRVTTTERGGDLVQNGESFSFYAQSLQGPVAGSYSAIGGRTSATTDSIDPAPEPGSMMLMSSGILGLVGLGLGNFRRKRYSWTDLAAD